MSHDAFDLYERPTCVGRAIKIPFPVTLTFIRQVSGEGVFTVRYLSEGWSVQFAPDVEWLFKPGNYVVMEKMFRAPSREDPLGQYPDWSKFFVLTEDELRAKYRGTDEDN